MKLWTVLLAGVLALGSPGRRCGAPHGRRRLDRPPVFQRHAAPEHAAVHGAHRADQRAAQHRARRDAGRGARSAAAGAACWAAWPPAWASQAGARPRLRRRLRQHPADRCRRPGGRDGRGHDSRRSQPMPAAPVRALTATAASAPTRRCRRASTTRQKVGNDASARPWESGFDTQHSQDAAAGVRIGSGLGAQQKAALQGSQTWGIPARLRHRGFPAVRQAQLRDAAGRLGPRRHVDLRGMMTDEMLREIRKQLGRSRPVPAGGARRPKS
jgi:hypothetical protein